MADKQDAPKLEAVRGLTVSGELVASFKAVTGATHYETYIKDKSGTFIFLSQKIAANGSGVVAIDISRLDRNPAVDFIKPDKYYLSVIVHNSTGESKPVIKSFRINMIQSFMLDHVQLQREIEAIRNKPGTPATEKRLEALSVRMKEIEVLLKKVGTSEEMTQIRTDLSAIHKELNGAVKQLKQLPPLALADAKPKKPAKVSKKIPTPAPSPSSLPVKKPEEKDKTNGHEENLGKPTEEPAQVPPASDPKPKDDPKVKDEKKLDEPAKEPVDHHEKEKPVKDQENDNKKKSGHGGSSETPPLVQDPKQREGWSGSAKFLAFVLGLVLGLVAILSMFYCVIREQSSTNTRSDAVAAKATAVREMEKNNEVTAKIIDEFNRMKTEHVNESRRQQAVPPPPPATEPIPTNRPTTMVPTDWQPAPAPTINVVVENHITVQQPSSPPVQITGACNERRPQVGRIVTFGSWQPTGLRNRTMLELPNGYYEL